MIVLFWPMCYLHTCCLIFTYFGTFTGDCMSFFFSLTPFSCGSGADILCFLLKWCWCSLLLKVGFECPCTKPGVLWFIYVIIWRFFRQYNLICTWRCILPYGSIEGQLFSTDERFLVSHVKYFSRTPIVTEHHSSLIPQYAVLKENKLN